MKITGLIVRLTALFVVLATPAFSASILNPGFENGLTGWTVIVDYLSGDTQTFENGVGQTYAARVASHTSVPSGTTTYSPMEGNWFLELNTGPADSNVATVGVFQSFSAQEGDTLSGYAAFDSGVVLGRLSSREYAQTIIESDNILAVPFDQTVMDLGGDGEGEWTKWTWTAPTDGEYTLFYLLSNAKITDQTSYAMFDAVPIPASLLIFGSGLIGLVGLKRRFG